MIYDIAVIVVAVSFASTLVVEGIIPPWQALVVVFVLVLFRAFGRLMPGGRGSMIGMLFNLGLPLLSLTMLLLSIRTRGIEPEKRPQFVGLLAFCFVMLFFLYMITARGPTQSMRAKWNLPILASILFFVLSLFIGGYISLTRAIIFFLLLSSIYAFRGKMGSRLDRTIRSTYKVALPLAALAVSLLIFLPRKGLQSSSILLLIVTLVVLILAFAILVGGLKSR